MKGYTNVRSYKAAIYIDNYIADEKYANVMNESLVPLTRIILLSFAKLETLLNSQNVLFIS
jgi:hypothetical protein